MRIWCRLGGCGTWTGWGTMQLTKPLTSGVGEWTLGSLMLCVISLEYVGRWYPIVVDLHRFFIAISRAVVNRDDSLGTAQILLSGLLVLFPRGAV